MKSSEQLREEIEILLRASNWREAGPHGRTISAVMKRVKILHRRAVKKEMSIVRPAMRRVK